MRVAGSFRGSLVLVIIGIKSSLEQENQAEKLGLVTTEYTESTEGSIKERSL